MTFSPDLFAPKDAALFGGLIDRYRPMAGVYDELLDASGSVRPNWVRLLRRLASEGRTALEQRFLSADQYLRESGVFYRVYDTRAGEDRAWPLSHIPLMIEADDWERLSAGLIERATLLDRVLGDLYGPASLVETGVLPAAAVAGSPEFFRPLKGVDPRGGFMTLYAADVGRGPDGTWWVLGDRTQAPSGAGYALENRLAMMRVLSQTYDTLNVERLAGFFQQLRATLSARTLDREGRVCVLTPGPLNETYFEHAYLARYLGFLLVEGADLTVRDDALYIRTVSGLKRADVLWRRLDADFADPLELNTGSQLGVPGLVGAVRSNQLMLVNALGSGLLESPALLAFLPSIAQRWLKRDLALPHIATWWCGQHIEREAVLSALDSFVIAPAFGATVPGVLDSGPVLVSDLPPAEKARLADEIRARGADFVAQEVVKLSTTPVWSEGELVPRPFTLRVFLAKGENGWTVMPGGFARIADRLDVRAITMQRGVRTADVCIMGRGPVERPTLLPRPDEVVIRRSTGALPSRAADNLFWLGRYAERAEANLRLLRALGGHFTGAEDVAGDAPRRIVDLLTAWGALPEEPMRTAPAYLAATALFSRDLGGGIHANCRRAGNAASVIRDRFSPDAWRTLSDLNALLDRGGDAASCEADAFETVEEALRLLASFSGLAQENMNQQIGWRFLEIGRRIERALITCRFVRQFGGAAADATGLDLLLALADSQISYRMRYVMVAARAPVLDLVLLDPRNPRSVAFQTERLMEHMRALPGHTADGILNAGERRLASTITALRVTDAAAVDDETLVAIEGGLMDLSDDVNQRYFTHRRLDTFTADDAS